nr:flagellar hook-length control protein [Salmonella sp. NCTC 7297]
MITLPQLITTDTDMTAGLTSGKNTGSAEDFLALLAGALGADGAQGKDARIHAGRFTGGRRQIIERVTGPTWRIGSGGEACRPAGAKSEYDG